MLHKNTLSLLFLQERNVKVPLASLWRSMPWFLKALLALLLWFRKFEMLPPICYTFFWWNFLQFPMFYRFIMVCLFASCIWAITKLYIFQQIIHQLEHLIWTCADQYHFLITVDLLLVNSASIASAVSQKVHTWWLHIWLVFLPSGNTTQRLHYICRSQASSKDLYK